MRILYYLDVSLFQCVLHTNSTIIYNKIFAINDTTEKLMHLHELLHGDTCLDGRRAKILYRKKSKVILGQIQDKYTRMR